MNKFITITMYVLWILTIIAILATTFTSFRFMDLNVIAIILFCFSLINTFFRTTKL